MKTYVLRVTETITREICVEAEDENQLEKYMSGEILLDLVNEEIISTETRNYDIIDIEECS